MTLLHDDRCDEMLVQMVHVFRYSAMYSADRYIYIYAPPFVNSIQYNATGFLSGRTHGQVSQQLPVDNDVRRTHKTPCLLNINQDEHEMK